MTDWTDFAGNLENGVLTTVELMQQLINNTTNIYERVNVLESLKGGGVPVGAVMIWKGSYETIPDGFQLADGTNGTPDLRGKFIVGISASETDSNLQETGGDTQHTQAMGVVTAATKHKHSVYLNYSYTSASALTNAETGNISWPNHTHSWSAETNTADEHTHTGTYAASDHLPPYTMYYYIARIPA